MNAVGRPPEAPLLAAHGIGLIRGGTRILHDVDFAIRPGEIVTIVGPNGAGKTSFLRLLIGAERPSAGRIDRAADLRIGYVPQRLSIDHTMPITVDRFLGLGGAPARARAAALDRVGVPGIEARQLTQLSGGQTQRVLVAQALLVRPNLLVLDEASQGLDHQGMARFYRLIAALRVELPCAILMVSHDLHVVMSASDRVVCLNGHVCCEGTPTSVAAAPAYRALFGMGTQGALALYRHNHDHRHDETAHEHHDDRTDSHAPAPRSGGTGRSRG